VRAEFRQEENGSERMVAAATWTGRGVEIEGPDEAARWLLERVFRAAPVSVDDPSLRSFGTRGEVVLQPGSLRWFMAAAGSRARAEGLKVRFFGSADTAMGWDPAGAYRTFVSTAERVDAPRTAPVSSTESSRRPL